MTLDNDNRHDDSGRPAAVPTPAAGAKKGGKATATVAAVCLAMSGALIAGAAVGGKSTDDSTALYAEPDASPAAEAAAVPAAPETAARATDTAVPLEKAQDNTVALASLPQKESAAGPETVPVTPSLDAVIEETARQFAPVAGPETPPESLLEPQEVVRVLSVGRGDTLMAMLTGEGIDRRAAHNAISAMSKVFSPRKLKPGQELHVTLLPPAQQTQDAPFELISLNLPESAVREVRVSRLDDGAFEAEAIDKPTVTRAVSAQGAIETSLYEAAIADGVPPKVLAQLIQVFSFDIDFQREIQKGDRFALLYESVLAEDQVVGHGDIQVAEMTVRGDRRRYYRFKDEHGFWDYFDEKGRSVRKALLRTPIDGARLSSRYGKRKHPILGYTKMHRGVDFAAPTGTPIYAAGDGTIEVAGRNGAYGKYIRIRHNSTYKTAYAHLSRIKIGKGKRVRQGQVIGYVGTTGRSTGPHLHYEVHQNGKQTNPLSVKLPTGKTLTGSQLAAFQKRRAELDAQYATLTAETQVAEKN